MWSVWAQLQDSSKQRTKAEMSRAKNINASHYVDIILKECTNSIVLLLIFNPIQVYISPHFYVVYFFFAIIFFDWFSKGACANPAVSVAQCIDGTISLYECLAHFIGYLLAAHMAYPILSFLQPIDTIVGPLQFHATDAHPKYIFVKEFVSTLFLILAVEAVPYFQNQWTGRGFISIAIRCITNYAGKYAAFNPLIPLCWIIFSDQIHEVTDVYFIVYLVAPTMGAIVGALIYLGMRDYRFIPEKPVQQRLPPVSMENFVTVVVSPVFLCFFAFSTGIWASYLISADK